MSLSLRVSRAIETNLIVATAFAGGGWLAYAATAFAASR